LFCSVKIIIFKMGTKKIKFVNKIVLVNFLLSNDSVAEIRYNKLIKDENG